MGIGGLGIGKVLIVVLIVLVLFGTKRLRSLGSDLGETVKGFRKALGKDDR
jgi:sec-independent protein translocase protein TatA